MLNGHVNLLAVVVAAVINMVVGAIWYAPQVMGKTWSKLVGCKMEDMQKNAQKGYPIAAVGALIESWVLAHLIYGTTFATGLKWAFWIWLAFVAVTMSIGTVFAGKPWKLWQIDTGYFLIVLLIQGGLLATWK